MDGSGVEVAGRDPVGLARRHPITLAFLLIVRSPT
jgi:hypothetical protein